jgi:hypothetical protein
VRKLRLVSVVVLGWLIVTGVYAFYYIISILSDTEAGYDAYAMNWQFQLLMFTIFRLPYLLLVLLVLIGVALVLPNQRNNESV